MTLIELMIVVVIIGTLSALAIPSFRGYIYRARTAEATTFLGEMRHRQESYRAEHGQYCNVSGATGLGNAYPNSAPTAEAADWGTPPVNWTQLGARPDGQVRFRYLSVAGPPGVAATNWGVNATDFWWTSQAIGDLDGNGTFMFMETYSAATHVFIGQGDGSGTATALDKGWE